VAGVPGEAAHVAPLTARVGRPRPDGREAASLQEVAPLPRRREASASEEEP
jgi:hypothetical protein